MFVGAGEKNGSGSYGMSRECFNLSNNQSEEYGSMKVAYCTGFWCTNIGNGFFSLGVEYVLKKIFGTENVTIVSDYQTYTTSYGKRLYPHRKQLEYISYLDVDYIVLAGPVLSKYFLSLWKEILEKLKARGIGYIILSAGTMKLDSESRKAIKEFFKTCPPFILSSRDRSVYDEFGQFASHAYDGICFSFFVSDLYAPAKMSSAGEYIVCNFDKIVEPKIWQTNHDGCHADRDFVFQGNTYDVAYSKLLNQAMSKTDRFTDALIYVLSLFPAPKRADSIGKYKIIRTDQRFYPHYRSKIYRQNNSFCADLPYGYLNLYANATLTLSDRVHACAATLAFGNSAMLFVSTDRLGLLGRVGAERITEHPVQIDLKLLADEKSRMVEWLGKMITEGR